MRTLLFILAFLSFLNLSGQTRVWNPSKTFSFIPVEGWENYSREDTLVYAQPLQSESDNFRENIRINVYPANGMTLHQAWNSMVVRDFPKSFQDYKMLQTGNSVINGKNAKWIEFTNTDFNVRFKDLAYMFVEDGKMYYIICLSTMTENPLVEKAFKQMVESFEIL